MAFYDYQIDRGVLVTLLLVGLAIGLILMVFFLLNLRGLLLEVKRENRAMEPNHVWLNLIPLFSLVWMIITVIRVRDSVRAEFQSRGWAAQGDFGYAVGLGFAILCIVQLVISFGSIASLVCWIIYWVKTSNLKGELRRPQPVSGGASAAASPGYGTPIPPGGTDGTGAPSSATPGRVCPFCGTKGEAGDVFCKTCGRGSSADAETSSGTDLPETPETSDFECPVCGVANRPNAKFCRSCGRSFP